ncbi:hypothetical protein F5888DRAFT_1611949 [Russula emetica]|nr:hypothetical protein F5888DRAFT_1611949 [Russula emetica]
MGLDFCSAPASSVDAECAFSVGRLEVNHLQHNTSPQTFKAQVAIGSWARTPLYPGLSKTIKIVENQMRGENQIKAGDKEAGTNDEEKLSDSDEEARFFL